MLAPFADYTQYGDQFTDPTPAHHAWTHFPGGRDEIPWLAQLFEAIQAFLDTGGSSAGFTLFTQQLDELGLFG